MYFSRVRLDPRVLHSADQLPSLDSPYREHQLLWQLFDTDPDASRDFLFRREQDSTHPGFYLLSQRQPASRDGLWQIESKAYRPQLQQGQTLAFSLRANPVVTRSNASGKAQRHDLVMDLKTQSGWKTRNPGQRPSLPELMQQAGEQWLAPRLVKNGAKLRSLQAESYQQHRHQKKDRGKPIHFSSMDLSGLLTVVDPERLTRALCNGIGPAKAFGCGLLLVRKI